jgi:hypothetical protein
VCNRIVVATTGIDLAALSRTTSLTFAEIGLEDAELDLSSAAKVSRTFFVIVELAGVGLLAVTRLVEVDGLRLLALGRRLPTASQPLRKALEILE